MYFTHAQTNAFRAGASLPAHLLDRSLFLVVLLCALVQLCNAQYRASIQGVVSDPSGAVIPAATLTLTNQATNEKQVRTSNAEGVYNFNALSPDHFTLQVVKEGYATKVLNNVQVLPEQSNALNVQLAVSSESQSVTVDASQSPVIDTQTGSITGTISNNQIEHMPSFGRDVLQLTQLAPGTFGDASQAGGGGTFNLPASKGPGGSGAGAGIFQTENQVQTLANGGQSQNNGISIDGISTTSAVWGGATVITPTEDSVGNIHVVSNGYDAENGRFNGAQIQVTSKTGSNEIHGSAFFQANRPGLNAYQRYNTPGGGGELRDNQMYNQFGGSLGGPIWKNKIFAFIAYETLRNNSSVTATGWYETAAIDSLASSGSIAASILGFEGASVNAKSIIPTTCANIGLSENVNCITVYGQGLNIGSPLKNGLGKQDLGWTSPSSPGVGGGLNGSVADIAEYITVNPTNQVQQQYNGRLDANVTAKDHASFAVYWVPVDKTNYNGAVRAYNLWHHSQLNEALAGIWNHTFSPTFLNEARANAAGWRYNEVSSNPQAPFGLPQNHVGNIGSASLEYIGASGPAVYNQWTYSYKDVATKILGRHTIKFGGELTRLYYLNENPGSARPAFGFFNVWDFINDAPSSESGTFDPTTGTPTAARQDNREDIWGGFVQDDYKVTPNLVLNLGVRYSYFGSLSAKQGNLYSVRFSSGDSTLTGMSIVKGGTLWDPQKANVSPEFGFAFTPSFFGNKVVFRGGFGLNYNQNEIAISSNSYSNPGLTVSPNFTMSTPSSPNPGIVYAVASDVHSLYGYPSNPNTIGSFGTNGLPTGNAIAVSAFDRNMPTTYVEHFSFQTEVDAGHHFVASLGYQGSLSRHTYFHYDENAVASVKGLALNSQVNSVSYYGNNGTGNYNAMLAGLRHQFSKQFMADAQYTWSKSMDTSSDPYSQQNYPYSPRLSYGRSDYNIGQAFKIYGLWQPVIFHGRHNWLEKAVGGWSLSGIFNWHTGFPWSPVFTPVGGSLYCSTCGYSQLYPAAYLGGAGHSTSNDAYKSGPGVGNGVNTNFPLAAQSSNAAEAYFAPPTSTPGPTFPATGSTTPQAPGIARNSLTGPGYKDLDGTISKSFGLPHIPILGGNAKLDFRIDAFNLFNNLNFNPTSISNNIQQKNFGQAQSALGARVINLQTRFSF